MKTKEARMGVFVFVVASLLLSVSACSGSTPAPGIDEPVVVRGVDLVFTEFSLLTSWRNPRTGQTARASSPYTHLASVRAETVNINDVNAPCDWQGNDQIALSWTRNRRQERNDWGICGASMSTGQLHFLFATYSDAEDYTIILPGGVEVPIQTLLD